MLILVAHGSRDSRWRASVHDLGESVGKSLPSEEVKVAFMQFDGPTLPEVVEAAVRSGHEKAHLLPLFMASAGHVDKDIKPLVSDLARAHPEIELSLMTPIGENEEFPGFIVDIVTRS
jgi:sirohydrochlorin cobaltochelatase